jgi:cytochrome c-type biogenesis protein CcmF
VYERFVVPLALILVLLSGIGPLIAWRKATAKNLERNLLRPALVGVAVVVLCLLFGVTGSWTALLMFGFGGFVVGGVGQELWRGTRARRAASTESAPVALLSLIKRNRRRYGGYFVHVGIVVLFVGVAASSSFKAVRDVTLRPGQSAKVGDATFTYVKPVSQLHAASNGRLERIEFGAELKVTRAGATKAMRTSKDYFPSMQGGPIGRFFEGESTTEVALDSGLHKDVWAAVAPDIVKLQPRIKEGDALFTKAADDLSPEDSNKFLVLALEGLTKQYAVNPPPARFRFEVNPLVTWIWLGGLIVLFGGFVAGWPAPRTRTVRARYAARVGRDVRERVPA